jgi:hypothetical protein
VGMIRKGVITLADSIGDGKEELGAIYRFGGAVGQLVGRFCVGSM